MLYWPYVRRNLWKIFDIKLFDMLPYCSGSDIITYPRWQQQEAETFLEHFLFQRKTFFGPESLFPIFYHFTFHWQFETDKYFSSPLFTIISVVVDMNIFLVIISHWTAYSHSLIIWWCWPWMAPGRSCSGPDITSLSCGHQITSTLHSMSQDHTQPQRKSRGECSFPGLGDCLVKRQQIKDVSFIKTVTTLISLMIIKLGKIWISRSEREKVDLLLMCSFS